MPKGVYVLPSTSTAPRPPKKVSLLAVSFAVADRLLQTSRRTRNVHFAIDFSTLDIPSYPTNPHTPSPELRAQIRMQSCKREAPAKSSGAAASPASLAAVSSHSTIEQFTSAEVPMTLDPVDTATTASRPGYFIHMGIKPRKPLSAHKFAKQGPKVSQPVPTEKAPIRCGLIGAGRMTTQPVLKQNTLDQPLNKAETLPAPEPSLSFSSTHYVPSSSSPSSAPVAACGSATDLLRACSNDIALQKAKIRDTQSDLDRHKRVLLAMEQKAAHLARVADNKSKHVVAVTTSVSQRALRAPAVQSSSSKETQLCSQASDNRNDEDSQKYYADFPDELFHDVAESSTNRNDNEPQAAKLQKDATIPAKLSGQPKTSSIQRPLAAHEQVQSKKKSRDKVFEALETIANCKLDDDSEADHDADMGAVVGADAHSAHSLGLQARPRDTPAAFQKEVIRLSEPSGVPLSALQPIQSSQTCPASPDVASAHAILQKVPPHQRSASPTDDSDSDIDSDDDTGLSRARRVTSAHLAKLCSKPATIQAANARKVARTALVATPMPALPVPRISKASARPNMVPAVRSTGSKRSLAPTASRPPLKLARMRSDGSSSDTELPLPSTEPVPQPPTKRVAKLIAQSKAPEVTVSPFLVTTHAVAPIASVSTVGKMSAKRCAETDLGPTDGHKRALRDGGDKAKADMSAYPNAYEDERTREQMWRERHEIQRQISILRCKYQVTSAELRLAALSYHAALQTSWTCDVAAFWLAGLAIAKKKAAWPTKEPLKGAPIVFRTISDIDSLWQAIKNCPSIPDEYRSTRTFGAFVAHHCAQLSALDWLLLVNNLQQDLGIKTILDIACFLIFAVGLEHTPDGNLAGDILRAFMNPDMFEKHAFTSAIAFLGVGTDTLLIERYRGAIPDEHLHLGLDGEALLRFCKAMVRTGASFDSEIGITEDCVDVFRTKLQRLQRFLSAYPKEVAMRLYQCALSATHPPGDFDRVEDFAWARWSAGDANMLADDE